jgi:UDP-N-acetylglucosamine--N-acetylmuramyl-(pentapeptide) pyrophosphoryl-undecaprenol N-acetylglucosamine transferase
MRVVVTGGGTGGHLFPAMAAVEALRRRRPEAEVLFVGAARGVEAAILPRAGQPFRGLEVSPVAGRDALARLRTVLALPLVVARARGILREFGPTVVLGVGGYASVPTVVAARLERIPVVLHEQNAYPGLANRWLARWAAAVGVSFDAAAGHFPAGRATVTGNPVRAAITPGDPAPARRALGLEPERFTVLVFGGSQGAHRLNAGVRDALPELAAGPRRFQFVHATGPRDLDEMRRAYRAQGTPARVEPFLDDMASAYRAADFALCRAGAGTIFELAAVGKPALLVPYPHAANDHQRQNAEAMVQAGGAWLLLDEYCDGPRITATLGAAHDKPEQLRSMAVKAATLARPRAADGIVDLLEQAAGT